MQHHHRFSVTLWTQCKILACMRPRALIHAWFSTWNHSYDSPLYTVAAVMLSFLKRWNWKLMSLWSISDVWVSIQSVLHFTKIQFVLLVMCEYLPPSLRLTHQDGSKSHMRWLAQEIRIIEMRRIDYITVRSRYKFRLSGNLRNDIILACIAKNSVHAVLQTSRSIHERNALATFYKNPRIYLQWHEEWIYRRINTLLIHPCFFSTPRISTWHAF